MSWEPLYQTRFIETVRRNAQEIAERDHEAVCAYYNSQPDANGIVLQRFEKIVNTRFFELFMKDRVEFYPLLIIAADNANAPERGRWLDSSYTLTIEVWIVGSDPFALRAKLERYATATAQMFLAAAMKAGDYTKSTAAVEGSAVTVNIGKHQYRPISAAGPNFYQDIVTMPLVIKFEER